MDPTERFSDRVADYRLYRPGYPAGLLEILRDEVGLRPDLVIADIGSGTGLLTRVFLDYGNLVYGIEPNQAMRAAGEAELAGYGNFRSLDGRAEDTGLESSSTDMVVSGQAFHWFDPDPARREFARILRGRGPVVLIWNDRNHHSPFEQEYAQLMQELAPDYGRVRAGRSDMQVVSDFFGGQLSTASCANEQRLDRSALLGRLLSSSCVEAPRDEVERRCGDLFTAHHQDGEVVLSYTTRVHWGNVG